jgi:hypothetical protein
MAALTTRCIKPEDFSCVTRGVYTWLIMPALNQEQILHWPQLKVVRALGRGTIHDSAEHL